MDQYDKMKVARQAMNGRMCLMFGGIFLIFSAITSTLMYGINFFMTALEADKGTAEYVELLQKAGIQSGLLKGIGICFVAVGIWEVVVGFLSVKNANRIDKSQFTVKIVLSLLIVELVMQVILFFTGLMNLGLLFTAIVLPLFLLWGATRYRKVAKAEPERKFAVDPAKKKAPQQSQPAVPKKSIRERAAMQVREDIVEPEETVISGDKIEPEGTVASGDEVEPKETAASGDEIEPEGTVTSGDEVEPEGTVASEDATESTTQQD